MQHALASAHPSAMQSDQHKNTPPSVQDHTDQVLQDQLLAAQLHAAQQVPPPRPGQPGPPLQPAHGGPRDHPNIDPAMSGAPSGMIHAPVPPPVGMEEASPDGRKMYGKRELSTSKRAAQNRAAQRAFRQRKESYIRKLEEQVKDCEMLENQLKAVQSENYQLREYIIQLQSRLIASQNEVPEVPGNIDLSLPRHDPNAQPGASTGHQGQPGGGEQGDALNRIAVAGLGMRKHQHEEAAFLGHNNFPQKRMRSEGEGSPGEDVHKSEGLPPPTGP